MTSGGQKNAVYSSVLIAAAILSTTAAPIAKYATATNPSVFSATATTPPALYSVAHTTGVFNGFYWNWELGSRLLWGDGTPIGIN